MVHSVLKEMAPSHVLYFFPRFLDLLIELTMATNIPVKPSKINKPLFFKILTCKSFVYNALPVCLSCLFVS